MTTRASNDRVIVEPHDERGSDVHSDRGAGFPRDLNNHPELATDDRSFSYSGFKRKFSFFRPDIRSMSNTGTRGVFHCVLSPGRRQGLVPKACHFRQLEVAPTPDIRIAPHNEAHTAANISRATRATASA